MSVGIELVAPPVPEERKIEGVLRPSGYRVLVQILPPPGGGENKWHDLLHLPEDARDREWGAQIWGEVIDLGPDAYKDEKRFPSGPWCKKGDAIFLRPYTGTRFKIDDNLYALINDDTVMALVFDPKRIERV